ncbi:CAP domain-containing protein [Blastococcus capsensis]|uniref:CAP domain-containing protein n=1 Tax=Blastococcus capsensis TaxID=1564163 RepID=UPI00254106CC|nr:CAP domain-containing protein [Blastococcus capsensis]MDK3257908.1 CAP domain-containing protein [Blastococcus capsensis]
MTTHRHARHRTLLGVLYALALTTTGCVVVDTTDGSIGAATGPAPQTPPAAGSEAAPEERMAREIFDRVNDERRERGIEPVEWNEELAGVARDWSAAMAERGVLEHQDVQEVLSRDALSGFAGMGENIFTASGPVPAGFAHVGWMRSDGHRVNVLNPGWNRLGVGIYCAPDGSVWAAQEFGRTVDADRPEVSRETPPVEPIARPQEDGPSCA